VGPLAMSRRVLHFLEALALMAVLAFAYVIYSRFCLDIPSSVAIMYLMLFSLIGWIIDVLWPEIDNTADPATAYPPALRRSISQLFAEILTVFRNPRALILLFVTGALWYLYWLILFSMVKGSGVFVVLILLQLPLVLGPIAMILSFKEERNQLKNITIFTFGVLLVFFGVIVHKYSRGVYGFQWTALVLALLLLVLVLSNKLIRLHLIKYVTDFGGWSRLSRPMSVRIFFLFNFIIAFIISLTVAAFDRDPFIITNVQLISMAFLGIVPTALCGLWEQRLGYRLGSFAILEGFHGAKTGLSVPLDFLIYVPCQMLPSLACIGGFSGLPDLWYFGGFCCTVSGIFIAFRQIKD
jgi:hypothetical protein